MRKAVSLLIIFTLLAAPLSVLASEAQQEEEIKRIVKAYFDLRYRSLSTLTYDDGIKKFFVPYILNSKEAVGEWDVLDTIIRYRKSQVNDLGFSRYKYDLTYSGVEVSGDKAWAVLDESCEFYFNCAPTVKNQWNTVHSIMLEKNEDRWLILKDDYSDPDGIKKTLGRYFLENQISMEEAKNKFLTESENQLNKRIAKLGNMIKDMNMGNALVFFVGKPVAYAGGEVVKIDSNSAVTPRAAGSTVLVPLRFIAERLGARTDWDERTSTVEIREGVHAVEMKIGSEYMWIDGKKTPLEVPAQLVCNRILLPVGELSQAFGKKAFWDERGLVILGEEEFDGDRDKVLTDRLVQYFNALFAKSDFPRIDGSTATYPLSIEIGKELLGLDETGAKGFITHHTTHSAYVNLVNGSADIIFVTQPSPEEYELAREKGIELEVVPICKEGFVFLVNRKNTVTGLTTEEVQDIYQGKIKNWKELGGEDSPIIAYQREENSGSQTIMENTVMKGLKLMQPPKEEIIVGMGELIDRVADYSNAKNALGYSVYYYATQMYGNRDVKFLEINGVQPDKQTIKDGTYPYTVSYYAVVRQDEPRDSNARKLLEWLLGEEGQAVVDRAGLVSVK
ncbi:MAG: substrate-binding domain-containing protein [Clostridiales bacterium]|jgi:phosphate transport system substrate-binding protein|nr:substrate-binding domain-containing protein [Eubacteriales bacterium]MDH7566701.1 substrate-binding domain-containing protein [Clostridiales bacterium]